MKCGSLGTFALLIVTAVAPARADVTSLDSLRIGGYVEAGYAASTHPQAGAIVGALYSREHDEFTLNAVQVALDRPAGGDHMAVGVSAHLLFGTSATFLKARGLDLGPQGDLIQALVIVHVPTRAGALRVAAGKMPTMLGYEVLDNPSNPHLTPGNQFVFLENFTHTGVDMSWALHPRASFGAHVINGWDVVDDNNRSRAVMARVSCTPDDVTNLTLFGYAGDEQTTGDSQRRGVELLASRRFGSVAVTAQLDAGEESELDADWWGAGLWASVPLAPALDLALRADRMEDDGGTRTSGLLGFPVHDGMALTSITTTLRLRGPNACAARVEMRYDRSSLDAYDGERDQWVLAAGLSAAY